jgi:hypothetical protein
MLFHKICSAFWNSSTVDESAMLSPMNEFVVSTRNEQDHSKNVEFHTKASQRVRDSTRDKPIVDGHGSSSDNYDPK